MRTAAYMGLAGLWLLVALVAALGRLGLVVGAVTLFVCSLVAAAMAAGVERGVS